MPRPHQKRLWLQLVLPPLAGPACAAAACHACAAQRLLLPLLLQQQSCCLAAAPLPARPAGGTSSQSHTQVPGPCHGCDLLQYHLLQQAAEVELALLLLLCCCAAQVAMPVGGARPAAAAGAPAAIALPEALVTAHRGR